MSSLSTAEAETILTDLAAVFAREAPAPSVPGIESPNVDAIYRTLVEQIPAVVFMAYLDRAMGQAYVSPRIEEAIGFSQEEWLEGWQPEQLAFLFIENVGNLVCPASYDLGESLRFVLMSVTEGEDKPLKYPTIFNSADVAVITKVDLAEAVEFDWETAARNIQAVRPGMETMRVSSKTGAGMPEYIASLEARLAELRGAAVP